jgi:DNA-binding NtrC family response regulator
MASRPTILIADRNSHVRMYLTREMMTAGFHVIQAASADRVLGIASAEGAVDLLILDPDLPGLEQTTFLTTLRARNPLLCIVLHTHRHCDDEAFDIDAIGSVAIIEKNGDSAEKIKALVEHVLPGAARPGDRIPESQWRKGDTT